MTAPQRLQALRPPGRTRHAEALRLRPFALEVFFLGTAMGFLIFDGDRQDCGLGAYR